MSNFLKIVGQRKATFEAISRGIEDVRIMLSAKGLEKGDREIEETVLRLTEFLQTLEKGAARVKAIAQIGTGKRNSVFFANLTKEVAAMKRLRSHLLLAVKKPSQATLDTIHDLTEEIKQLMGRAV